MNIEKVITEATIKAVKELYGQDVPEKMVQLQKTKDTFEGNLTLVVSPHSKSVRCCSATARLWHASTWSRDSSTSWWHLRRG